MWANYDYSKFPIVKVTFNEKIESEEDFNEFLKKWVLLYDNKKDFTFILDSSNISTFNISYVFKMRKFIKKIKEFPHQYLKKSWTNLKTMTIGQIWVFKKYIYHQGKIINL